MQANKTKTSDLLHRIFLMSMVTAVAGGLTWWAGLTGRSQIMATSIFAMIISSTLLFWESRLAIAFIGIAGLLGGSVITLEQMVRSAELEIILFLVGMMTMVGVLKDLGLFTWIIQTVINLRAMSGRFFVIVTVIVSALLACVVDEVTSIVVVLALVFQVCDTLKVRPVPFVMIAVIATNIGSCGTMLGNPVGILIGTKAGFSFGDFLAKATPVMFFSLFISLLVMLYFYRIEIAELDERLAKRRAMQLGLGPLVNIPFKRGLFILFSAITLIAMHHTLESSLGVQKNTLLIVAPLLIAGILMIWRKERARHYIEAEVEWWTLLFFMMLFSVAGSLEHSGVTEHVAHAFKEHFGGSPGLLTPLVIVLAALGSAFVDNIVFVAAFIPVIKGIGSEQLWWALLFGACFGGNITVIGSTANIVALGMMEKRYRSHVGFTEWLKIGGIIGGITCCSAWFMIEFLR